MESSLGTSETTNSDEREQSDMDSQQIIAIFFTVLMIGSAIAYGAALVF